MKAGVGLYSALVLCLLMGAVFSQRPRPKKPPKPPKATKRPSFKPDPPPDELEPQEPTDFPPPILGPLPCSLTNNYISVVTAEPFNNATELRWVDMANNRIKKVDKQVFEKLRLSHNQISKIPSGAFGKMEHLALLDLHHNKLSDSDMGKNTFKDLKNLVQLNLAHNILKKMPANIPNGITQLFLDRNNIDDIPK
ncbi:hypothetical protein J4Q44_G00080960 [Coregonus suidteri]|uniref:Uncharacterized protein n=1 Tax=Coregonus suidteri TaxID=861788 RepID=A0AAN8LYB9_9TELE